VHTYDDRNRNYTRRSGGSIIRSGKGLGAPLDPKPEKMREIYKPVIRACMNIERVGHGPVAGFTP